MMSKVQSINTRLLYPFRYDSESHKKLTEKNAIVQHSLWQPTEKQSEFYQQEMLDGVSDFIFGNRPEMPQHYTVPADLSSTWFARGVTVEFNKKEQFTAKLSTQAKIELFLLPQGVGVLSIPLTADNLQEETALKRFNYRLSQCLPTKTPTLMLPESNHPSAPKSPAAESPLLERLGKRGGQWTLNELRDLLLEPLKAFEFKPAQAHFSVYSVLHFTELDFTDSTTQTELQPLLAGLTHVEEPLHPGSLSINAQCLNSRHWTAVGTLGSVHFVADQKDVPFNDQRVPTVLNKYFLTFLVCMMQRLILQDILCSAQAKLHASLHEDLQHLQKLHNNLLAFTLTGYLSEISSREVINQYYLLAKSGLRVDENFQTLRRALHDADESLAANSSQQNLHQMVSMHSKIEWLEVFFASYYAGALVYYVSYGWFDKGFSSAGSLLWAIIVGLVALFGLTPWKHDHDAHDAHKDNGFKKYFISPVIELFEKYFKPIIVITFVGFFVWLLIGATFFLKDY